MTDKDILEKSKEIYIRCFDDDFKYPDVLNAIRIGVEEGSLELVQEMIANKTIVTKNKVVDAIAYAIYYTANPDSEMCIPNCAYEKAEKMFKEWRDETREKKAVELLTKEERNCKNCGKTSCKNYGCDLPFTCGSYKEKK